MEDNKVEKTLKESNNITYVNDVEYKIYLILGSSPSHKSKRIDITNSIPDEIIEEYYTCKESDITEPALPEMGKDYKYPHYDGIAASVIGIQETINSPEINDGDEIPLTNPLGIFVSIQQKINTALQAAIVNERQLNALTTMIDGIFKQCEYERALGLKKCIDENS